MTWELRAGAAQTDVASNTLPNVAVSRGMRIQEQRLSPTPGTLSATLDADRLRIDETLELREGADTFWRGDVEDLKQSVDRGLNQLRWRVRALGPLARVVSAGEGFSTDLLSDISVDQAIIALLDAIGVPASERDIGPSPRRLAVWWLTARTNPWTELQTLVRTAGPTARLYEDAQGRIAFRDTPAAMMPDHTVWGRNFPGRARRSSAGSSATIPAVNGSSTRPTSTTRTRAYRGRAWWGRAAGSAWAPKTKARRSRHARTQLTSGERTTTSSS